MSMNKALSGHDRLMEMAKAGELVGRCLFVGDDPTTSGITRGIIREVQLPDDGVFVFALKPAWNMETGQKVDGVDIAIQLGGERKPVFQPDTDVILIEGEPFWVSICNCAL